MQAARFFASSPLEVGDVVKVKGWDINAVVTEIDVIHHASSGEVEIRHYVDGWRIPLSAIECRIECGVRIPINRHQVVSEEVRR